MTARLLYSATMSLDGYIAGPGGDMSWLSGLSVDDVDVPGLMGRIGSLLIGRRTFTGDDPNAGTDAEGAFGGAWQGPSVVLSRTPRESTTPEVTWSTDLRAAVATAQEAAGDRYVNVLGAEVARACLEAGLLDEVMVYLAPVLLGDGTPLFAHPGGHRVALRRVTDRPGGAAAQWYEVVR